jgi:hypothetical protein
MHSWSGPLHKSTSDWQFITYSNNFPAKLLKYLRNYLKALSGVRGLGNTAEFDTGERAEAGHLRPALPLMPQGLTDEQGDVPRARQVPPCREKAAGARDADGHHGASCLHRGLEGAQSQREERGARAASSLVEDEHRGALLEQLRGVGRILNAPPGAESIHREVARPADGGAHERKP